LGAGKNVTTTSSTGLKREVERLQMALGLPASLPLAATVRKASEALCAPSDGPLLLLVRRMSDTLLPALAQRVHRIQLELSLTSSSTVAGGAEPEGTGVARGGPGSQIFSIVAAANAQLGMSQQAPLCKQVDRLFEVIGISGSLWAP